MPYDPTVWVDDTTPLSAANLNNIEEGLDAAHTALDTLSASAEDIIVNPTVGGDADVQSALETHESRLDAAEVDIAALAWELQFSALACQAWTAAYATGDTRNGVPVMDFDGTAAEAIQLFGVLPSTYAGGGLTISVYWSATSVTSGAVVWVTAFEAIVAGSTDLDSNNFASDVQHAAASTDSVSGEVTKTDLVVTDGAQMDSLAAGGMFRMKLARLPTDAGDTMADDAEVSLIVIRET